MHTKKIFSNNNVFYENVEDKSVIYSLNNGKIAVLNNLSINTDKKNYGFLSEEEYKNTECFLKENGFFDTDSVIENFLLDFPQKVKFEQLYMIVTDDCNLKCKYCRQTQPSSANYMSIDDVEYAIEKFSQLSDTLKSIVFYGGEPLMNTEAVFHAIDYANKKFGKGSVSYSMITNATLCNEQIAKRLASENVSIIVSVDGNKKMNDCARTTADCSFTYDDVIRGYNLLKNAGCCIGTNSVIGPHNQYEFDGLLEWIRNLGPNTVGFALPHGDKDNYAMDVEFKNIHNKIVESFDLLRKDGISVIQVERKIKDIILNNVNSFECRAAKNRLVACANKMFGVCEGAVTNSDFFSKNIDDALEIAKHFQQTTPLILDDCKSCIAKRVCGGGCPYDKLMRYGKVNCADPYRCGFIKKVVYCALRFIGNNIECENEKVHILDDKDRKLLYKKLNFAKSNFVPLSYNCDARFDK